MGQPMSYLLIIRVVDVGEAPTSRILDMFSLQFGGL